MEQIIIKYKDGSERVVDKGALVELKESENIKEESLNEKGRVKGGV